MKEHIFSAYSFSQTLKVPDKMIHVPIQRRVVINIFVPFPLPDIKQQVRVCMKEVISPKSCRIVGAMDVDRSFTPPMDYAHNVAFVVGVRCKPTYKQA